MKNLSFFILYLIFSSYLMAQSNEAPQVSITITDSINSEYNLLGLSTVGVMVENKSDIPVLINSLSHLCFEAKVHSSDTWIRFYEGNLMFAGRRESVMIKAKEVIKYKTNLNLFDFARKYSETHGKIPDIPIEIILRAGIYSPENKVFYYSAEYTSIVNPLSDIDKKTFEYIQSKNYDPYQFTRKGELAVMFINESIANLVITDFPQSTFAELAFVSLAYRNAQEAKKRPEIKTSVTQLLSKPLTSQYSFVRYLAEELKKSLY